MGKPTGDTREPVCPHVEWPTCAHNVYVMSRMRNNPPVHCVHFMSRLCATCTSRDAYALHSHHVNMSHHTRHFMCAFALVALHTCMPEHVTSHVYYACRMPVVLLGIICCSDLHATYHAPVARYIAACHSPCHIAGHKPQHSMHAGHYVAPIHAPFWAI